MRSMICLEADKNEARVEAILLMSTKWQPTAKGEIKWDTK